MMIMMTTGEESAKGKWKVELGFISKGNTNNMCALTELLYSREGV